MFEFLERRAERKAKAEAAKTLALHEESWSKVSGVIEPGVMKLEVEPVKAAIKTAKHLETGSEEEIKDEIERLKNILNSLLPIESDSKMVLEAKIKVLSLNLIDRIFPRISLDILKWRRKDGWPCFALYKTDEIGVCRFSLDSWDGVNLTPRIHCSLYDTYKDVFRKIRVMNEHPYRDKRKSAIESVFKGHIPREVLNKCAYKNHQFDDIFIVAEANWEEILAPSLDPMIIGLKNNGEKPICWLLASFDLTPVEELAKREWTTGPEKENDW
jgi:hypothetical protein